MYIEDYLELLAGEIPCEHCGNFWVVSLARYDYSPVRSMSTTITMGRGLSDKQRELALKIVAKYKKQLLKHGYDISDIESDPQWRSPLRKVDRSKKVYIEDDKICVRFPFSPQMVDFFRRYSRTKEFNIEAGHIEWSKEKKVWVLDCTERNATIVHDATKNEKFEYSNEFLNLSKQITNINSVSKKYSIVCDIEHNKVVIHNAPEALQEVFERHGNNNILYDIGLAKKCGVTQYSLRLCRHLYKIDPLLVKLVAKRVIYFEDKSTVNLLKQRLDLLNLTVIDSSDASEGILNGDVAYFTETIHGIKAKYVEQRVPLVLYCTPYAPHYDTDAYYLEGY